MGSILSIPANDSDLLSTADSNDTRSLRKSEEYNGAERGAIQRASEGYTIRHSAYDFLFEFIGTMRLSCTVFEILWLIVQKLKSHVTVTMPLSGTICRP